MNQFADIVELAEQKVGKIAAIQPGAAAVFQKRGINFNGRADQTLADAATGLALNIHALIDEIVAAAPARETDGFGTDLSSADLIEHIKARYHAVHLRELPALIALAGKVEAVHQNVALAPKGLADLLARLHAEMTMHQKREEIVLFPMMLAGGSPMIAAAIATMRAEHDDHTASLLEIDRLTNGRTAPDDACSKWRMLCADLTKFCDDLVMHLHLENDILFPRFAEAARPSAIRARVGAEIVE